MCCSFKLTFNGVESSEGHLNMIPFQEVTRPSEWLGKHNILIHTKGEGLHRDWFKLQGLIGGKLWKTTMWHQISVQHDPWCEGSRFTIAVKPHLMWCSQRSEAAGHWASSPGRWAARCSRCHPTWRWYGASTPPAISACSRKSSCCHVDLYIRTCGSDKGVNR